jgi:hypothetical protein
MDAWVLTMKLVAFLLWFATFTPSERIALSAAFLVFVGVAGEYVVEIHSIEKNERLKTRIKRLAMALLLLGLAGDVLGVVMGQSEMAALTREAGDAQKSAKEAEGASAIAKSDAKTAHDEADAVHTQAGAIEKRLDGASERLKQIDSDVLAQGPRSKTLEHDKNELLKAIRRFAGQRATVVICGNDETERGSFEQVLINVLREAKWDPPGYTRWAGCPNMLGAGILMYFVSSTDDSAEWVDLLPHDWLRVDCGRFNVSHDAFNTLCDALTKSQIFTSGFRERPLSDGMDAQRARAFFGMGEPDGPAEMAYKDPGRIFILVGTARPMFRDESKQLTKRARHK